MSDLTKIKISRIFTSCTFWIATIVLYLQSRGLSLDEIYKIISFYSICVVILEYPTGVIGDYFSHKLSVFGGYLISGIGLFLLGFKGSFMYYAFTMFIGALGVSLTSGSDTALLHKVSRNFKKDLSEIKSLSIIFTVIAISLGGLVGKFNSGIPIFLTAIVFLAASPFILFIRGDNRSDNNVGNIFSKASEGLKLTLKDIPLSTLVFFSGIVMAFYLSFKWFYNPLFEQLQIDASLWGVLISLLTLLTALGTKIFGSNKNINFGYVLISVIATMTLVGFTQLIPVSILGLLSLFILRGVIETQLEVILNKEITDSVRASVLSLKNLIARLTSSLYLLGAGAILAKSSFLILMLLTVVFIAIGGVLTLFALKNKSHR